MQYEMGTPNINDNPGFVNFPASANLLQGHSCTIRAPCSARYRLCPSFPAALSLRRRLRQANGTPARTEDEHMSPTPARQSNNCPRLANETTPPACRTNEHAATLLQHLLDHPGQSYVLPGNITSINSAVETRSLEYFDQRMAKSVSDFACTEYTNCFSSSDK